MPSIAEEMYAKEKAHQAVLDSFRKKREIIKQFFKEKGKWKFRAVKVGGPCDWCPPFKDFHLHVCLNCGRKLD